MKGRSSLPCTRNKTEHFKTTIAVNNAPNFWSAVKLKNVKIRLEFHRQRALSLGKKSLYIPVEQLIAVYAKFNNRCAYCQRPGQKLQIEHVRPLSKDGQHLIENLVPACKRCNKSKCASDVVYWYGKCKWFGAERWNKIIKHIPGLPLILFSPDQITALQKTATRKCGSRNTQNATCAEMDFYQKHLTECVSCRARRILGNS